MLEQDTFAQFSDDELELFPEGTCNLIKIIFIVVQLENEGIYQSDDDLDDGSDEDEDSSSSEESSDADSGLLFYCSRAHFSEFGPELTFSGRKTSDDSEVNNKKHNLGIIRTN